MRSRSDLVEIFSTFLMFEGGSSGGLSRNRVTWTPDSALRRSMRQAIQTQAEDQASAQSENQSSALSEDEKLWAIYWHRLWSESQSVNLDAQTGARRIVNHLIAYLQEPGYWGAYKVFRSLKSTQHQHCFNDFFQNAMGRVAKVLRGFDPVVSTSLRSYAEYSFSNIIKDQLRQNREVDACTPWGLLNRVSRKRLTEALQRGGIQGDLQQQYLLAWSCYREHYGPTASKASGQAAQSGTSQPAKGGKAEKKGSLRKLTKPSAEIWQAIADTYNHERTSQLSTPAPATTPAALEDQLINAVALLRNLQNPRAISLDAPLKGQDGESSDFYNLVPDDNQASPMGELINQEAQQQRQAQHQQLSDALGEAIAQFAPTDQALLQAYYGDQLTQSEIAKRLDLKQYSISRKLSRLRRQLLQALLDWQAKLVATDTVTETKKSGSTKSTSTKSAALHNDLSPAVLDAMGNSLEEWLATHYCSSSTSDAQPEATSLRSPAATAS